MIIGNNWTWFIYTQDCFLERSYLLECFTETNFDTIEPTDVKQNLKQINIIDIDSYEFNKEHKNTKVKYLYRFDLTSDVVVQLPKPKLGKIYFIPNYVLNKTVPQGYYGVVNVTPDQVDLMLLRVEPLNDIENITVKLFDFRDIFNLKNNMIDNYTSNEEIPTTIGRFFLNRTLLVEPFGNQLSYINDSHWKIKNLEKKISKFVLNEIDSSNVKKLYSKDQKENEREVVKRIKQYKDNIYFIGHFGEISIPSFTEKSLTLDPKIEKLKHDLLEKHKHELDNPNVIIKIEEQLVQADKDNLKDDPSMNYFIEDKNWNVQRKRLFLMIGLVESFAGSQNYTFIPSSLTEGWKIEDMPAIVNEIRNGIYGRAVKTADTGMIAKFLLRIFQNTIIKTDDCHSNHGLTFTLTNDNYNLFQSRFIMTSNGLVLLTDANKDKYINRSITIRSPLYCKATTGLCKVCVGKILDQLNLESVGVFTLEITEPLFTASMKSMHGKSVQNDVIKDITSFIV
jgi:hypothetical protein